MGHRARQIIIAAILFLIAGAMIMSFTPATAASNETDEAYYVTLTTNHAQQTVEAGKPIQKVEFIVETNVDSQPSLSLSSNLPGLRQGRYEELSHENPRRTKLSFYGTVDPNQTRGTYKIIGEGSVPGSLNKVVAYINVIDPKEPVKDADSIEAANYQTCVVTPKKTVKCWGRNTTGQVGAALTESIVPYPHEVPGLTNVKQVTTGNHFSCALKNDNTVWCWGANDFYQLGDGTRNPSVTPVKVQGLPYTTISSIASGPTHTCVITGAGAVYCWGHNNMGQLGNGTINFDFSSPVKATMPSPAKQISMGAAHTCAVDTNGYVYCWGQNNHRQLAQPTANSRFPSPVKIAGNDKYKYVSAGFDFTCGITTTKVVKCWGNNNFGQLGSGKTPSEMPYQYRPTQIPNILNVKQLDTGYYHACAINGADGMYCWGQGTYGQLPLIGTSNRIAPKYTGVDTKYGTVAELGLGAHHSCMVNTKGATYCWGNKSFGQLGDGTKIEIQSGQILTQNTPSKVIFKP